VEDGLSAFRDGSEQVDSAYEVFGELELLVLTQGSLLLAIAAIAVDSVVAWIEPVAIPEASARVLGIVQDRGRLVAVTRPLDPNAKSHRLIVCGSTLGLVGIPATNTRSIGAVALRGPHVVGQPVSTELGSLTVLDIEAIAQSMVNGRSE
jgi:chemotaxis signal transduction protein